jgi:hypothetical protein
MGDDGHFKGFLPHLALDHEIMLSRNMEANPIEIMFLSQRSVS